VGGTCISCFVVRLLTQSSAVFQAGGLIVVLIEVARKAYLASIVPVIVNAILNEHQIVVDIVAFVNRGDFPRSRLGEKQRGKILASWVTRKMRTMAQFGIRDADSALSDVAETMEPRSKVASLRNGSVIASSLRNVDTAPQIIEQRELEQQQIREQQYQQHSASIPMPAGISEMPAFNYDEPLESPKKTESFNDATPIADPHGFQFELPTNSYENKGEYLSRKDDTPATALPEVPPPKIASHRPLSPAPKQLEAHEGDLWSLPSQQRGGLRVQNADVDIEEEDQTWKNDAIMYQNLAGRP